MVNNQSQIRLKNFIKSVAKNIAYFFLAPFLTRRGEKNAIYLTFDDGPHLKNTPLILNRLAEHQCKATFFMVGEWMEKYPDIVKQVIKGGHTIGFHSFHHISLNQVTVEELKQDRFNLLRLRKMFNYPIKLYRPPFGDIGFISFIKLVLSGLHIVMWSLDSRDSFDSFETIKSHLQPEKFCPGEIILLHDDYPKCEELLNEVLPRLKSSNWQCRAL